MINCTLDCALFRVWSNLEVTHDLHLVSCGRSLVKVPIRLSCYILSSRAPEEVCLNINWDVFWEGRNFVIRLHFPIKWLPKRATTCLHSSLTDEELLGVLGMRQCNFDQTHQSKVLETNKSLRGFYQEGLHECFDLDNLLTIGDSYWRNSESTFHFRLCRACCVPFIWAAYFCMSAYDDVIVVIEMGALYMGACFANSIIWNTPRVVGTVYISPDPLLSGARRLLYVLCVMARTLCRFFLQNKAVSEEDEHSWPFL